MFTHQKKPCRAICVQYNGSNNDEVFSLLSAGGFSVERMGEYIILRKEEHLKAITAGEWVVQGENGAVKTYSDSEFNVKYTKLP